MATSSPLRSALSFALALAVAMVVLRTTLFPSLPAPPPPPSQPQPQPRRAPTTLSPSPAPTVPELQQQHHHHDRDGGDGDPLDTRLAPPRERAATATATVVTAYFNLRRMGATEKHGAAHYVSVGRNVLSLMSPMVLFTDDDEVVRLRHELVGSSSMLTRVVRMSFAELDVVRNHADDVKRAFPRDREAQHFRKPNSPAESMYSPELYLVYMAKPELVARAVHLNPFKTTHFVWVDLGSMRDWGGIAVADITKPNVWPHPRKVHLLGGDNGHKVLMQAVGGHDVPCKSASLIEPTAAEGESYPPPHASAKHYTDAVDVPGPLIPGVWFIAGAIFGGEASALVRYADVYNDLLRRYFARGERDAYDMLDQHFMGAVACAHPDLVSVVRPPPKCCVARVNRKWFFLYLWLAKGELPREAYTAEERKARGMGP